MLRIVYGLKLDCEVALRTRRIGWRDTTNTGGVNSQQSSSALTIGFAKATMITMMKMKIIHSTSGHEALGSLGPSTRGTAEAGEDPRGGGHHRLRLGARLRGGDRGGFQVVRKPSILGRSRAQCSGIVRTFRHNNNTLFVSRAAVFRGMQQLDFSSPSAGTRPPTAAMKIPTSRRG